MFKTSCKYILFAVVAFIAACSNNKQPVIKFSHDRSSIIIKNFDEASLLRVKNNYLHDPDFNKLIAVLLQPGEQDSLQDEKLLPGKLMFNGDSLVFKPSRSFKKNETYVVESYINATFADAGKIISGKASYNLKPQRQILKW